MLRRCTLLSLVLVIASGCCFGGTGLPGSAPPAPTPPVGTTPTTAVAPVAPGATISLAPGFMPDPQVSTGAAGGPVAANTMSPDCRGHIPAQPSLIINATAAFANLRIVASSSADTTLVVQRADGTFLCNDDSEGLNPIVQGAFGPGQHRVWVGTWSPTGAGAAYTLGVTELASVTAASLGAAGGAAAGGGTPVAGETRTGNLGPGDAQLQSGEYRDTYEFAWTAGQRVQIDCTGDFDNYLILRRPSGTQVDNDDTNGTNAQIIETLTETGTYTVVVTTYAPGQTGSYTLTIR
ncbi:pre-peptidase C-terminal domain-containing protein [Sandaracinus amylolyticus]|uniref:Peptidase C-terminal archaeal/bacterial domain-containing protein n=1 Tax=Sandaracinus amylolyticus TaxID=927083 RepID=A0A0F6SDM0_9BACT|nr:pre-peptidase C-terminal domain-containing protein [Sandaracinus amylolyticus]AKF03679.1 hypothetical protein DB32_000828 [Sandaracinus amylolyticus]